jgi:hypothetical protein
VATSTLMSEDVMDRQSAAATEILAAQQHLVETAFELSRAGAEAARQLNGALISAMFEMSERSAATTRRSLEQLNDTISQLGSNGQATAQKSSTSRHAKDPVAA